MNSRTLNCVFVMTSESEVIASFPFLEELLKATSEDLLIFTQKEFAPLFEAAMDLGLAKFRQRVSVHASNFTFKNAWVNFQWLRGQCKDSQVKRAFCLDPSLATALAASSVRPSQNFGFSSSAFSFLYTHIVASKHESGQALGHRYLDLLRRAEISDVEWDPLRRKSLLGGVVRADPSAIAFSLRCRGQAGLWPLENTIDFLRKCLVEGLSIKLLGGEAEQARALEIQRKLNSPLIENCLSRNWSDELKVFRGCKILIAGDCRDVAVASDLGLPVLALFGPNLPDFGEGPWRRHSRVLAVANLRCRPCHRFSPDQCPQGHHKCLKDIAADRAFGQMQEMMQNAETEFSPASRPR